MSDDNKKPECKMDPRCPRKLETHPESWCPLAVMRLKAVRNAGRELTEEEESKLPGCPWAVNHQLSSYCFFKYMNDFAEKGLPSEAEIAHMLNISQDTVKKTQKGAIDKIRSEHSFAEIIESHKDSGSILTDSDHDMYKVQK